MIIRPDKRHFKIFDVLIEFKFVTLKDAGLTGESAKQLSNKELLAIPEIKKALDDGEHQVIRYGKQLDDKYGNLRLKKYVVAALGFERICFRASIETSDYGYIRLFSRTKIPTREVCSAVTTNHHSPFYHVFGVCFILRFTISIVKGCFRKAFMSTLRYRTMNPSDGSDVPASTSLQQQV